MEVRRIEESPRVTKPYREEEWQAIEALGHRIDERLRAGDVRLTMGGEPTFVSIDDREGAEWNLTALGPDEAAACRPAAEAAPRSLCARWRCSTTGRGSGIPASRCRGGPSAATGGGTARPSGRTPACSPTKSRLWLRRGRSRPVHPDPGRPARRRPRARDCPAIEDVWYYLWKERRLPVNVDVLENHLEDPEERLRLARVFEQGLDQVVGYALPLRRKASDESEGAALGQRHRGSSAASTCS